ncbi:mitochondrial glycoprotein [Echria macrotheca]|uniref:Mitochondrial glycoprotein n=1 Tax=Echria macrotheca TaxID=438768 RepID=A0AAJ0BI29_9PEZI|nr:mitochondrial glycoprotein [Echria macrotheca]
MMSLRAFARSAPRALSRASSSVARCQRSSLIRTARPTAFVRPQQTSAFSTTVFRRAAESETSEELSAKLASEIEFEESVQENEPMPASVKDFLQNGPFEIVDIPGQEEVVLTRTYGNEKITVTFSIADLQNYDPEMYDEDSALGDDLTEGRQDSREAEEAEDGLEGEEPPVPCRLNVVVEKPGKGALTIEAVAQDGAIVVENLFYYKDAKLAHGKTADAAHASQEVYPGPPFGSLDEDLQILMERYLEERGITQALAVFAPDYMDMKEQKEYLAWLNNVKGFVDA